MEFDALAEAAGAVVVTVTVGVAEGLLEDAQPATVATQTNAATCEDKPTGSGNPWKVR